MKHHGARIKRLHPDERKLKSNAKDCGYLIRVLSHRYKLWASMYVTLTILYVAFTMDMTVNQEIYQQTVNDTRVVRFDEVVFRDANIDGNSNPGEYPVVSVSKRYEPTVSPMLTSIQMQVARAVHVDGRRQISHINHNNHDVRPPHLTVNTSDSLTLQVSKNVGNNELTEKKIYLKTACNNNSAYVLEFTNLTKPLMQMFQGKLLCSGLRRINRATKNMESPKECTTPHPTIVNITISCYDEFYRNKCCGTGNMIQLLYSIRIVAKLYPNMDVIFACNDANEMKRELILPWLMGVFLATLPNHVNGQGSNKSLPKTSSSNLCGEHHYLPPVSYMYKEIIYDFRKMAIHVLGVMQLRNATKQHPSVSYAESTFYSVQRGSMKSQRQLDGNTGDIPLLPIPKRNDQPLFPLNEDELDLTVIHFRCGDLMNSTHPDYSFMKFSGYTRHISPEATSIGIITQPFEVGTQSRDLDLQPALFNRCYTVVHALVQYIQERYPNARVRIRNNSTEPITVAFARMIMANQTIVGASSFSIMPAIATFGTGYIRLPTKKSPNRWLIRPRIDQFVSNVILFEEPNIIKVADLKRLWEVEGETGVLNWFRNDSLQLSSTTDLPTN